METLVLDSATNFPDAYGNTMFSYVVKEGDEENKIYYKYNKDNENLGEGTYKLVIGEEAEDGTEHILYTSGYEIHIGNTETVSFPVLSEGENSIRSGRTTNGPCWYEFTPSEDGTYLFDNCGLVEAFEKDGLSEQNYAGYSDVFYLTGGTTYYLGFYGDVDGSYDLTVDITHTMGPKVVDIIPDGTKSISGLTYAGKGTQFTLQYTDAMDVTGTVDGNWFEDDYGNEIAIRFKNKETGMIYDYYVTKPEGDYALVFEYNGSTIGTTDYVYKVSSIENSELPELTEGPNHIVSGDEEYNWYKFKALETGRYTISKKANIQVCEVTDNGVNNVGGYYGWNTTAGKVYCIGFSGAIYDNDIYDDVYEWDADLFKVNTIKSISDIVPANTEAVEKVGASEIAHGTTFTINYENISEEVTVSGTYYDDNRGNILYFYLKNKETKVRYMDGSSAPVGNYALEFVDAADGKTIAATDYVFTITALDQAQFPELVLGENTVTAGEDDNHVNWYQFKAPDTGRYGFDKRSNMRVSYINENGGLQNDYVYDGSFQTEQDVTYYIGFWNGYYDEDEGETLKTWTTTLELLPEVAEIKVVPAKTTFYKIPELSQNYIKLDTLTFVYKGGTSKEFTDFNDYHSSNIDGKGNGIYTYLTSKKEDDDKQYESWWELEPGEYTVHIRYNRNSEVETTYDITVEEEPTPFNGKAEAKELELGKTYTVNLDDTTYAEWFHYTPEEGIAVTFSSAGKQDTYGYIYDSDGEVLAENDDGVDNNFIVSNALKAGSTYYFKARMNNVGDTGTFTVSLKEKQNIQSLEVVDHNLKPYYLQGTGIRGLNVLLKATYQGGSSEMLDEYTCDSYGNSVSREYVDASGAVTYDISEVGTYTLQMRYGEADTQVAVVGKFQVLALADYAKLVASEEEQELDATEDSVMRYQFTADEAGIYQLNSNVPFSKLTVYNEEQKRVELSWHRSGYTGYAALQPGTYYVVANLSSQVTKLKVSVTKAVLPTKVTASIGKSELVAGVDNLREANLAANLEYTNDTTGWVYGEDADAYGNWVSYDVTKDDSEWNMGDTLPVGTYTVKPVVFRTGTSRWNEDSVDNEALHEVLKEENINSLEINVVKPDTASMTAVKENEYVEVSGNARRQFFAFTPDEDGTYTVEYDRARMGATAEFYVDREDYLDNQGETIKAKAGKTYVVVANRYVDYQFRIVKKSAETATKQIQKVDIVAEKGYITELSSYQIRESGQVFLRVTYTDGTTLPVDMPSFVDGSCDESRDEYGNVFTVDRDSFEEIEKDGQTYLRITVHYGDLTTTKEILYSAMEERAIDITTKEPVAAKDSNYFRFVPEETAEYIITVEAGNGDDAEIGEFTPWRNISDRSYYVTDNKQYRTANVSLQKGRTYYFDVNVYRDIETASYTVSLKKIEKKVADLKITSDPEDLLVYEGIGLVNYSRIQAEVTYSDGTKETVSDEQVSDTGRKLSVNRTVWLNTKTYRVEVQFGKYRAHIDIPAKSLDYKGDMKLGTTVSPAAGNIVNAFSFTPAESATYQFVLNNIKQYGMNLYNADTMQSVTGFYNNIYALEANQKYSVVVINYNTPDTAFTITAYKEGEVPEEHEHTYVEDAKAATCTEPGYTQKVCSICGAVQEGSRTEIPATGHNPTATEAKEATCTEAGNHAYWTCEVCKKVFADEKGETETTVAEQQIAALGHDWVETVIEEATDTKDGIKALVCSRCKTEKEGSRETIPMTAHKMSDWEITKAATCTEAGSKTRSCTNADCALCKELGHVYTETETINALDHDMEVTDGYDATCTETGLYTYWTCKRCDKVFADKDGQTKTTPEQQIIPALGHSLTAVAAKDATCTTAGNNAYWFCQNCGNVYADADAKEATTIKDQVIPALGHQMGDWTETTPATCTEPGIMTRSCGRGDKTETAEIPATGHKLTATAEKAATCEEAGNKAYWTCQKCKKVYADAEAKEETTVEAQTIPATGHKMGDWTVTTPATCEEAGIETRSCKNCDKTETREISATGHNFQDEKKDATCIENGYTQERCSRCNAVRNKEEIPATGHQYGEKVYSKNPTCTENGYYTETCEICGDVRSGMTEMTGHKFKTDEKAATCTEDGYSSQKCEVCGTVTDYQLIPATGHQYDDNWTVKEAASCTAEGKEVRTCKNCDNKETRSIPKTAHTWIKDVIKEATATDAGLEREICKDCNEERPDSRVTIPATGHKFGEWKVTKEATCTDTGLKTRTCENADCTLCNGVPYVEEQVIPAIGHDLQGVEWVTKEATCTEEGVRTMTCNRCQEIVESETIAKIPHKFEDQGQVATCTTDGFVQQICKVCHAKGERTELPATGHIFGEGTIEKEATCTSQGLITFTCTKCDAKRIGILPKTEHNWKSQATVEKQPTCTEEGLQDIRCQDCNAVKEGSETKIPATGHSWNANPTIDTQATCTTAGSQSIHCATCDAVKEGSETVIPAKGHDYDTHEVSATCTVAGSRISRCKVCGYTETEVLQVTGHNMQLNLEASTMQTCTSDGLLVYECQNKGCGQRSYEVKAAYEAHKWGAEQTQAATSDANGKKYQICERCGEEKVVEILLNDTQKNLVEQINQEDITAEEAVNAILDVDNEVLLSEAHKDLIAKVEENITNNGVNGKSYEKTTVSGNMTNKESSVTGATITAAAEALKNTPAMATFAMDDTALYAESSEAVKSNVDVTKTTEVTQNASGKDYFTFTVSMTVDNKNVVTLEKPVTVKAVAPEGFESTSCIIRNADGSEQNVDIAADGTLEFTTDSLGEKELVKISCIGSHTYDESKKTTTPATCTEPATTEQTCTKCHTTETTRTGDALSHKYEVVNSTPATCITAGSQTLKCTNSGCTAETITQTLEATGIHTYSVWKETEPATCTKAGSRTRHCTVDGCNAEESEVIPQTAHVYEDEYTVDKAATCTEAGTKSRHCVNYATCGSTTDPQTVEAKGHTFDEEHADWEGTLCLQTATVTCKDCGATKTISRSYQHDLKKTEAKAATCTEDGNNVYWTCQNCDKVFTDAEGTQETTAEAQIIKAKGHQLTPTPAKAATCVSEGTKGYWICDTCGEVFADENGKTETTVADQVISKGGHKLTQTPAKAATCVSEGTKGYWTCQTCKKVFADQNGKTETTVAAQKLGKTAHKFGSYQVTKKATVLAAGTETRSCSVCGQKESRSIAKLPGTIKLTTRKLPLQLKKSVQLSRIVTGMAEGDRIASCVSSNAKVATVDNSGKVSGKAAGTAVITIKLASGAIENVTIAVQKKVVTTTSIANVQKTWNANVGERKQLYPVISPITTTDKVTYTSSNKKVATVSGKGLITAKKSGTAKITVKSGKKKFTVTVKVAKAAPKGMTGVPASKSLKKKKSFTIKAKLTPAGAEAKITYKSSNTKVATVNSKGKVTAKGPGTAVITVKAGNITKTCTITVK